MKKRIFYIYSFLFLIVLASCDKQQSCNNQSNNSKEKPYLKINQSHVQLIVDGKPFAMIAGELHNSTSSVKDYYLKALEKSTSLNINTVIASIAWEQFEPIEGEFDYSLVDYLIEGAEEYNLKLVIIWFASWKNGVSSYNPMWVKEDENRFFTIKNKEGKNLSTNVDNNRTLSPFCKEAINADVKAFAALMKRIKEVDRNQTVILVQPENEVGAFCELDYNKESLELFNSSVPKELIEYMVENTEKLQPDIKKAWESTGMKKSGNWKEIFGSYNYDAENFFMSWHYAKYMDKLCEVGKKIYDIPMYVNSWLVQFPNQEPGKYPNGGPVARVIDIYRVAAKNIDFLAPDIYLPNYKEILDRYDTETNRPLFIPECERTNPGKAFYALAEHNAIGFAPFGIESVALDYEYRLSYRVLNELLPTIVKYQGTNKIRGFIKEGKSISDELTIGDYIAKITYEVKNDDDNAYGIIIQTSDNEFLVAGHRFRLSLHDKTKTNKKLAIGQVLEGGFEDNKWKTYRWLNGDETWHHNSVLVRNGRHYLLKNKNNIVEFERDIQIAPVLKQSLEEKFKNKKSVYAPGIYKVKVYKHSY